MKKANEIAELKEALRQATRTIAENKAVIAALLTRLAHAEGRIAVLKADFATLKRVIGSLRRKNMKKEA